MINKTKNGHLIISKQNIMKKIIILLIASVATLYIKAQGIGIGTIAPNTSSILDITSNSKGFLVPRMNTTQRTGIINPAKGLLVFDNTTNEFWLYDGVQWVIISSRLQIPGSGNVSYGQGNLQSNTTGNYNTAYGGAALMSNTSGSSSTAVGYLALGDNIGAGAYNTAVGYRALRLTSTSQYNTAIGYNAGSGGNSSFDYGYNNVFVGANTEANNNGCYNVIAIGNSTLSTTNTARFGNSATTSYGGWAGWSTISDGRFKNNVQENVSGLSFINKLRPVTYKLSATALNEFYHKNKKDSMSQTALEFYKRALNEKEQITYTGFIAQEVEATAKELGFDFSGVDKPKNENDTYGLRYAEFVVPLVKSVQEQQQIIQKQQQQIDALIKEVELLKENRKGK